ncbi:LOW QUALITY PROTEIN: uncharacterized protein LOC110873793 [Helianthus annuus]|uniref:LOW QUALITY PROTEIN: uncharacterized protein LOC110873793 n=1 Tax=Helianthus annuus TaxID=4232 RepID=UPI000B8FA7C0|nr:LOW QUALITY PROTEIN: uncharacterized protein LOC110873793 [Helianthus annuus]
MPNHLQEGKEVNFITFSIISSSSGRIETIKIQVGIYLLAFQPQSIQFRYRSGRRLGWGRSSLIILLRTFWYVLPPNYRSDPADEKENSALLLSRRTYPPRDSWNFSPPFGYAGTKSPLTTNQQTSSGWVLPGRSEQQVTPRRRFHSWAAVSRSRGRFAPCPRIWVICSHTMLLQSDLAGERSQFATENKTASERTFVRFFSTKHGSLRITVGRWLPKETPIRSAPRLGGIYLIPITRRGSL